MTAAGRDEPRVRGLPAIADAREARKKTRWPTTKFWGWSALVLIAGFILHWKWSQSEVESARQALLAKQRAVMVELGPRWLPLRDKVEGWTLGLAKEVGSEIVDRDALAGWDFRDKPGLYLRMRVEEAKDAEAIRRGAKASLHDGFTACLLRVANADPFGGRECKKTRDCPAGEQCNEADRCARPSQPYNLRVAYRALNILSDEWIRDVQDSTAELRVRMLAQAFDDTVRDDLPIAADLLTRAQYFLVLLDETPPDLAVPDGGTATQAVQGAAHAARVGLWRLSDGKQVLRIRREAGAELLGAEPTTAPQVLAARQRQAQSCALALAVRQSMGDGGAGTLTP